MQARIACVVIVSALVIGLGAAAATDAAGTGPKDSAAELRIRKAVPAVPSGHPRVYARSSDVLEIRKKIATPEFTPAWNDVMRATNDPQFGWLFKSFVYMVNGNRDIGRQAVGASLKALKKSNSARLFEDPIHLAAMTYDWCYDLLTDREKKEFAAEFARIAALESPGYPANPEAQAVVGHTSEGALLTGQLPAGLATYDENRDFYDASAFLFLKSFKPVRDFQYAGHAHHQGDSYITRFAFDMAASWLFRRIGAGDVLSRDQQFVPYRLIYGMRPDGQQIRSGDTWDDAGTSAVKRLVFLLTAYYYDDPYLLTMAEGNYFRSLGPFGSMYALLFRKPGLRARPLAELALSRYFPAPIGEMIARTGWNMGVKSRDAVVQMKIGEYFFGNHQKKDFGTFQVYYRGALAISSGVYGGRGGDYGADHWTNYYHQTVSQNGLLVFDPDERYVQWKKRTANDGGQRWPEDGNDHPSNLDVLKGRDYRMAQVLGHDIGPDPANPEYSYISGDITQSYSRKVDRVTRSMVALNTKDRTYPCVLVVFDRVNSRSDGMQKSWLLHSIQEPLVDSRTVTVVRDQGPYGGKLVVESLLPERALVRKIGGPGKEFWVEGARKNFAASKDPPAEPGAWRVEVAPSSPAMEDRFLHVLSVMDAGSPKGPKVRLVDGETTVGAAVLDRLVVFGKKGDLLEDARFDVIGEGNVAVLVCDLRPGHWAISRDGRKLGGNVPVTKEAACLNFRGGPGRYTLKLVEKREPAPAATRRMRR